MKHIRLRKFDYASPDSYFITVVVQSQHSLGEIRNQIMRLSEIGNTVALQIQMIPEKWPNVVLDEFIVMPDHFHCIIDILEQLTAGFQANEYAKPRQGSVSVMVNQLKGAVTKWCNGNGIKDFQWQSRFHDHVIRDHQSYQRIKQYIKNNPVVWERKRRRRGR